MKTTTNHESFIIKPSTIKGAGVGVFILHDVAKDTRMELFLPDFEEELRDKDDVPKELQGYCQNHLSARSFLKAWNCPKNISNLLNLM